MMKWRPGYHYGIVMATLASLNAGLLCALVTGDYQIMPWGLILVAFLLLIVAQILAGYLAGNAEKIWSEVLVRRRVEGYSEQQLASEVINERDQREAKWADRIRGATVGLLIVVFIGIVLLVAAACKKAATDRAAAAKAAATKAAADRPVADREAAVKATAD